MIFPDHFFQIAMGCCNDPDIHFDGVVASHTFDNLVLKAPDSSLIFEGADIGGQQQTEQDDKNAGGSKHQLDLPGNIEDSRNQAGACLA